MPSIDVHGLEIAYRQQGSGPSLLLLHSVLTDSKVWSRQFEGLSDAFTVVAWDVPGSGKSSDPPEGCSIVDYVETLAGFIDALQLDRPHIVGAAWGTVLPFEYYRAYPSAPRSLVLVSAYAGWSGSLPVEELTLQEYTDLADAAAILERFLDEVGLQRETPAFESWLPDAGRI